MVTVDVETGRIVPQTWQEVAEQLGISRQAVYVLRQSLGIEDLEPEDAYPRLAECRRVTSGRVGGDRRHTVQSYLRSKGHG